MNNKRKEFLECLLDICEYWKDKPNGVYGAIRSTLVMFDGCCGLNNFETIEIKGITNGYCLHDEFYGLRQERSKRNEK